MIHSDGKKEKPPRLMSRQIAKSPLTPARSVSSPQIQQRQHLKIIRNHVTNKVSIIIYQDHQNESSSMEKALQSSLGSVLESLSNTRAPLDRLIYAVAGHMFSPKSPPPFGGPKRCPGYVRFQGTTAMEVLIFLLSEGLKHFWRYRDQRAIIAVVNAANRVLVMQYLGIKDSLDELMMKGLKTAGHIQWKGSSIIPVHLRHADEMIKKRSEVEFVPCRFQQ